MDNLIPEDFGSKWSMSDLVLKTLNADGKELHASKHVLATYSPVFQAMFFGSDWKEKSSDSLNLDDDYEVVKMALRVMYQVGRSYGSLKLHSPHDLYHLYIFADKYDIPMIRKMCEEELLAQPCDASLRVSDYLDLRYVAEKLFLIEKEKTVVMAEKNSNLHTSLENELRQLREELTQGAEIRWKLRETDVKRRVETAEPHEIEPVVLQIENAMDVSHRQLDRFAKVAERKKKKAEKATENLEEIMLQMEDLFKPRLLDEDEEEDEGRKRLRQAKGFATERLKIKAAKHNLQAVGRRLVDASYQIEGARKYLEAAIHP